MQIFGYFYTEAKVTKRLNILSQLFSFLNYEKINYNCDVMI